MSPHSDAARRCSDIIRTHIVAGNAHRWAAIRLSDGGSDGIAYQHRADAMAHQLTPEQCAYVRIPPDDMPPEHAERYLAFHRKAYDAGFRLRDPDDRRELIMPYTREALAAFFQEVR